MDRDPLGFAATLQGENAMEADRLRRDAQRLRQNAALLEEEAARHEERAAWAGQLMEAFQACTSASGDAPKLTPTPEGSHDR